MLYPRRLHLSRSFGFPMEVGRLNPQMLDGSSKTGDTCHFAMSSRTDSCTWLVALRRLCPKTGKALRRRKSGTSYNESGTLFFHMSPIIIIRPDNSRRLRENNSAVWVQEKLNDY